MTSKDHDKIEIHRRLVNNLGNRIAIFYPQIDLIKFQEYYQKFCEFLGSSRLEPELIDDYILIQLVDKEHLEGAPYLLDIDFFTELLKNDITRSNNVFLVDYNGYWLNENAPIYDLELKSNSSDLCISNDAIGFLIRGRSINVIANNGKTVDLIDNINSLRSDLKIKPTSEPIENYENLIKRHVSEDLNKEKTIQYWERGREAGSHILKSAPEEIFNRALYQFLKNNAIYSVVNPEVKLDGGRDVIDIFIKCDYSDIAYLFEIKWLGLCAKSSSEYSHLRANIGLRQLHIYVSEFTNHKPIGVLVLYDARKNKSEIRYLDKILSELHDDVRDPVVINLVDSTSSKTAEAEVKKLFNSRNN
ncbi:hypothetical protein [Fulvivirga sp.]|uniref:hypothetical protein n=1 Tax=Fulvivirga sp. TaxID=1931237 RepID=UPI0032EE5AF9